MVFDEWIVKVVFNSDEGSVFICFSLFNIFGIVDYWVCLLDGLIVYVLLWVVCNGVGIIVLFMLF